MLSASRPDAPDARAQGGEIVRARAGPRRV